MKTKEEIAKKANLDLIISDQIDLIKPFLKNSTLPTSQDIEHDREMSYELIGGKDTSFQSISQNLPALLSEGKNKSIYVLDDGHWLGLYYNEGEKKLYFIDSFGHDYKVYENTAAQIKESLKIYPDIEIENLYKQKIQFAKVDKKNCGRFVGMTLVLLDHGVKPEEFQRLDSPIEIKTARMTNASLALAAEIDQTLFSESNKNGLSNLRTELAPIKLKKALNEYMTVVNDEVRKNIIGMTNDIIDELEKSDETQAQKLTMGLQNFTESPNQHNAKTLEKIMQEQYSNLPKQDSSNPVVDSDAFSPDDLQKAIQASLESAQPEVKQPIMQDQLSHLPTKDSDNQDVDSKGFSQDATNKPIQASVKSANSEVKQSNLKEKLYTCIESLRLFINTIGTSISNKFKSSPEKSPSSKSR